MLEPRSSDDLHPVRQRAAVLKQSWASKAAPPDAATALEDDPELASVKSIYLDLAYEEYCLRRQRGETVDVEHFVARFPRHCRALKELIETHLYLSKNPGLLPDA